jgi:malic enzyme
MTSEGACTELCAGAAGSAAAGGNISQQHALSHGADAAGCAVVDCAASVAAVDSERQYRQALALVDLAVGSVLDAAKQQQQRQQQQEYSSPGLVDGAMWLQSAVMLLQINKVGI